MKISFEQFQILKSTNKWLMDKTNELLEDLEKTDDPQEIKKILSEISYFRKKCDFEIKNIDDIISKLDNDYE